MRNRLKNMLLYNKIIHYKFNIWKVYTVLSVRLALCVFYLVSAI